MLDLEIFTLFMKKPLYIYICLVYNVHKIIKDSKGAVESHHSTALFLSDYGFF